MSQWLIYHLYTRRMVICKCPDSLSWQNILPNFSTAIVRRWWQLVFGCFSSPTTCRYMFVRYTCSAGGIGSKTDSTKPPFSCCKLSASLSSFLRCKRRLDNRSEWLHYWRGSQNISECNLWIKYFLRLINYNLMILRWTVCLMVWR